MNQWVALFRRWLETSSRKQKWTAALAVVGLVCTAVLFSLNGGSGTTRDPLGSTPLYFFGAFVKLVIVLLLIFVSAIFARRWMQPGFSGKSARQMKLVETVRLSPRQALHLVTVGDQQILIGATDQNVTLITHVEASLDETAVEPAQVVPVPGFEAVLQSFNLHLPGASK